jgi:hypothetical protein
MDMYGIDSMFSVGYIDAATGAMIIQWIGAAIAGLTIMYRLTIVRFFKFITAKIRGNNKSAADDSSEIDSEKSMPNENNDK